MRFVELGELVKIDRKIASSEDSKIFPYVGLDDIEKDSGHFSESFVAKPMAMLATNFKFSRAHVLYGKLRPYLNKVVLPPFEGVCTTEVLPILPDENKLDRTYLWGFLLSQPFVKWASSQVSGANLPRLDPNLLLNYRIPLTPLPEQQRIAAILQKADRLRRLRRYARRLSDTYLQSVFLVMFGDPDTNPKGWEIDSLDRILLETKNGFGQRFNYSPQGIIVLRIRDVSAGYIDYSDPRRMLINPLEIKDYRLQDGDLLFVRVNGNPELVGRVAVFGEQEEEILFSDHLIRAKVDRKLVEPIYLSEILNSSYGHRQTRNVVITTAGQFTINRTGLSTIKIPYPSIKLQKRFLTIYHNFMKLRVKQKESERQAEHLFQALLQRAFQGELYI